MISWKKDKKLHKDNDYFFVVNKLRLKMINKILKLNKETKTLRGCFGEREYLKSKPVEILVLTITDLIKEKKIINLKKQKK